MICASLFNMVRSGLLSVSFARSILAVDLIGLHLLHEVLLAGAFKFETFVRLSGVFLADVGDNAHRMCHWESVVPDEASYRISHVTNLRHLDE